MAIYTLFVYPLIALILAAIVRKKVAKKSIVPTVSFIIAAYNEENSIAEKIEQTLNLDYPKDKLEVIVASDGSTDRTDEIVRSFADRGVKLNRVEGRKGKDNALNETAELATGEILIFSDATGIYNKQAIRELAANFSDPTVGCVTGRVAYRYGGDANSRGFRAYQRTAVAIRKAEMHFGSQTSVSGSIHAVRRSIFRPATMSPDVTDALSSVIQGYRVVYESNAVSLEESRYSLKNEFRCRLRMGVRATSVIFYILAQLCRHRKFGYAAQMISHKILRWWLWCWLLVAFVTNLLLAPSSSFYMTLAVVQTLFYLTGLVGLLLAGLGLSVPVLSSIVFFVVGNVAMGVGAVKCLAGKRMGAWEPVR